jgi:hypothetical protein
MQAFRRDKPGDEAASAAKIARFETIVSAFGSAKRPQCAWVVVLAFTVACSSHAADAKRDTGQTSATPVSAAATPSAVPSTEGVLGDTVDDAGPTSAASGTPIGTDFGVEARLLAGVAACAEGAVVPPSFDQAVIGAHCRAQRAAYDRYELRWLAPAAAFFATVRPNHLPNRVVYPFGGGDLVTALAVFPRAVEITTLSLEPPGDVRLVRNVPKARLRAALRVTGQNVRKLLGFSYSNTVNLDVGARQALPGEIVLHLAALEVHDLEAVSLRYFRIGVDGSVRYLTDQELGEGEGPSTRSKRTPVDGRFDDRFDNVEIGFAPRGRRAPIKTLRHIAQDLSNAALGRTPGLLKYLAAQGPVAAMTKAASHLLWSDDFSAIREYLLDHAVWMVSDSTGVPPRFATAAGFVQEPYGVFEGPSAYGPVQKLDSRGFRQLFAESPKRPLAFRFGYGDVGRRAHLIVTKKPARAEPAPP